MNLKKKASKTWQSVGPSSARIDNNAPTFFEQIDNLYDISYILR